MLKYVLYKKGLKKVWYSKYFLSKIVAKIMLKCKVENLHYLTLVAESEW